VLVFFWGDRDVYGWWVAGDSVRGARLGRADSLEGPVSFLHRMVESPAPGGDWVPAARRVFDALVAPLTTADVDELLVVPDGPLAQIPFEVLVPDSGRQPLGARQRIIYGPSASVLVALARGRPQPVWKGTMLAVGDPAVRAVSQPDPFRDPRSPAPGPLPHAAAEARAVRDLFQQAGADLLLRNDATLDRWLAKDPGSYRYLHFAAHALVDTRRPEKTHVLLSGAELDLTAIRRLRLTAELVTLSACETGLGRRYRGEGVIGLPHAFLAAGARSVLVTLWRVEDEYAEKFMEEFYGQVASGTPPAAALETVRRRWIQAGGPESHPSHWAPFVLVGGLNSGEQ
jgi:CHAT domain-containing protein